MTTAALANWSKTSLTKIEEAVKAGYIYLLPCPEHIPFEKRHILYDAHARSFVRAEGKIDIEKYANYTREGSFYMLIGNAAVYKDGNKYNLYVPGQEVYSSESYDDVALKAKGDISGEYIIQLSATDVTTILMALEKIDCDDGIKAKFKKLIIKLA